MPVTVHGAKRIINTMLGHNGRSHRLTARRIGFEDLARGSCVFVKIHDWEPDLLAGELETLARMHGFRLEYA